MKNLIENIRLNCRNHKTRLMFTAGIPYSDDLIDSEVYLKHPARYKSSVKIKMAVAPCIKNRFENVLTIEYNR